MSPGFIYVMSNPAMPGIVKIGRTINHPKARAKDLHTTGVAAPFKVEFAMWADNHEDIEIDIHEQFNEFRITPNREFFRVDAMEVAAAIFEGTVYDHQVLHYDMSLCESDHLMLSHKHGVNPIDLMQVVQHIPDNAWAIAKQRHEEDRQRRALRCAVRGMSACKQGRHRLVLVGACDKVSEPAIPHLASLMSDVGAKFRVVDCRGIGRHGAVDDAITNESVEGLVLAVVDVVADDIQIANGGPRDSWLGAPYLASYATDIVVFSHSPEIRPDAVCMASQSGNKFDCHLMDRKVLTETTIEELMAKDFTKSSAIDQFNKEF